MNIKKINYLASLYENLVSFAALEDELIKLETSDDNKNFIKNISDVKYKGKIFSFLKKNPKISLQDLESQLKKEKAEDEKKEKLKESAIPPEWLPIINHLNTPEKLKVYLRALARGRNLPNLTEEVKHQLETIKNWLEENPDESIDTLTFQELFDTADEWLTETQKTETTKYEKIEIVYGPEWKNKQFNGHYITTITTENDLRLEGNLMSHCVGGYYPNVKEGSKKIFSLRSSSGKPLVTMDVSPDMYWFKQTFGYNNQQPNQLEMSMVNEWKQSLHPKDKIIELANGSEKDQIKAAQFMDYNDVKYKQIIDSFIQNGSDSGKEFLGIATENDPKDVLQALAANETLSEICYEQIYQKCSKNMSTVFNLIRNGSISSNLFRKLFDNHKKDEAILTIIASSIKMKEISLCIN